MNEPSIPASQPATKLLRLSEVALSLGYRDFRNFRLSVAPRLGLAVVKIGLRWFVDEQEYARVLRQVTAPGG
jgi:hypothetical protein